MSNDLKSRQVSGVFLPYAVLGFGVSGVAAWALGGWLGNSFSAHPASTVQRILDDASAISSLAGLFGVQTAICASAYLLLVGLIRVIFGGSLAYRSTQLFEIIATPFRHLEQIVRRTVRLTISAPTRFCVGVAFVGIGGHAWVEAVVYRFEAAGGLRVLGQNPTYEFWMIEAPGLTTTAALATIALLAVRAALQSWQYCQCIPTMLACLTVYSSLFLRFTDLIFGYFD